MEKVYFPLSYMDVLNENGDDTSLNLNSSSSKENVYAPFDGVIRKVYKIRGNYVWLESTSKVLWADGRVDYMVLLTSADDNVESLYVGKQIQKGEVYYTQGKSDHFPRNHVVLEVGCGPFHGNGWEEKEDGQWHVYGAENPTKAFVIGKNTRVEKEGPYSFIREEL